MNDEILWGIDEKNKEEKTMKNADYPAYPEVWKDINGYEGLYKVSNYSNVKSLQREVPRKKGANNSTYRTVQEKILKKFKRGRGYNCVRLTKNGKSKNKKVSRLVANAFVPNPENKPQVNHIDGVKTNDLPVNLEWSTLKENHRHAKINGLKATGECNGNSKLTKEEVLEIRDLYDRGEYSQRDLAEMFDMSRSPIQSIVNRKTWRHV